MFLTEFDAEKQRWLDRRDAKIEMAEQINRLNLILLEQGRVEDALRAAKDAEYQKKLLEELNIGFTDEE